MASRIITDISDFIFVEDTPEPADAIFLPGGTHAEQPEYAAALYRQGYGKWLIPSGGVSVKKERWPGVSSKADVYTGDYHTDCAFFIDVLRKNGVLDTASFTKTAERAWVFRTLGYGHGEELWRQIFSMLKIMGYDDSISIEHEDGLMSPKEGLEKAVAFVSRCIIRQDNTNMWWA